MKDEGEEVSLGSSTVSLRDVIETDLEYFFHHQLDTEATRMAAFPARDNHAHFAHWHTILADASVVAQTILVDGLVAGLVAGNIVGS
ncbi:MAG: hypothetical protein M3P18_16740 [Actinomycetota bacterium]|nr:hypothetical protein [Actinomycetota bacterium]